MSALLRISLTEVDFAIKSEPQGNIAGIYNILAFKQTLHQVEGDGITRVVIDQTSNYVTPRSRGVVAKVEKIGDQKRKENLRSAPLPKASTKQIPPTPGRQLLSAQRPSVPKSVHTPTIEEKSTKKRIIPKFLLSKYEKSSTPKHPTDFVTIKKTSMSADEYNRAAKISCQLAQKSVVNRVTAKHPIENVLRLDYSRTPLSVTPRLHTPRPPSSLATPTAAKRSTSAQVSEESKTDPKPVNLRLSERLPPK